MSVLEQLLHLQELDTVVDQLRHRRDHLPERAELEEIASAEKDLSSRRSEVSGRRDELAREQKRLEDEVALVEEKRRDTDAKLYGGSVTSPRELQSLQDEVGALARRQSTLEDEQLEIMTAVEPLDETLASLDAEEQALDTRRGEVERALAGAESEIDTELEGVTAERDTTAASLPADTLADYETKRRQLGGVAVARLVGTSCGGCHLTLSAVEIDRIKRLPPDVPAVCEECGRMLVH